MSEANEMLELEQIVKDAVDLLQRGSALAIQISGYSPGSAGDPKHGIPEEKPEEGWAAMVALGDRLDALANMVRLAPCRDVLQAFAAAQEYADEVMDRKDGQSL